LPTPCSCRNSNCLATGHRPPRACTAFAEVLQGEEILAGWIGSEGGMLCPRCGIAREGLEAAQQALREVFGDDYEPKSRRPRK